MEDKLDEKDIRLLDYINKIPKHLHCQVAEPT
jgi:hypothetical protein